MPRIGQEATRRAALVAATVEEIGAAGTLDVTVSQIARRAGMSTALAHHYFGGKTQIFLAGMRHILSEYRADVYEALIKAPDENRLEALIQANFTGSSFRAPAVSAWLSFYVLARKDEGAARLLRVYQKRLHSNLVHALKNRCDDPVAVARIIAAQIDGVYLRVALSGEFEGAAEQVMETTRALLQARA